jgi:catechol 2,3-dioxygenase-like lactoylglutathione lyase family enzyme
VITECLTSDDFPGDDTDMIKHFDHVTLVVEDLTDARRFFTTLGFREVMAAIISGPVMEAYMGVAGIEAEHITLVAEGVSPRTEVQLLHYRRPLPLPDLNIRDLHKIGLNHICFAVDDIVATVQSMQQAGYRTRNDIMDFQSRKLVFLEGPAGVTVELSEWH